MELIPVRLLPLQIKLGPLPPLGGYKDSNGLGSQGKLPNSTLSPLDPGGVVPMTPGQILQGLKDGINNTVVGPTLQSVQQDINNNPLNPINIWKDQLVFGFFAILFIVLIYALISGNPPQQIVVDAKNTAVKAAKVGEFLGV